MTPLTVSIVAAIASRARWTTIVRTELAALNARLKASGAGAIAAPSVEPQVTPPHTSG